jgi:hypothetical protein
VAGLAQQGEVCVVQKIWIDQPNPKKTKQLSFVSLFPLFVQNYSSKMQSLILPKHLILQRMSAQNSGIVATSSEKKYDLNYYLKGALAGGICCAVTHGALW